MKKSLTILLLITSNLLFSQFNNNDRNQVNTIVYGIYNKCTNVWLVEPSRKSPVDAFEDLEIWNRNGNNEDKCWEIQAKGSARIDYSKRWRDQGLLKEVYYKDTVERFDAVVYKDINKSAYGGWFNLRKHYERYGQDEYLVDIEELPNQPTRYVHDSIREQDSLKVTRQYFFTKHWVWSSREHNNIDSLKAMPFSQWSVSVPGTDTLDNQEVRRITKSFFAKYYQMRAKDTTFNTIDTLRIYGNWLMKLP